MFGGQPEKLLIIAVTVIVALVLIIFLTPVFSWLSAAYNNLRSSLPVTSPKPPATLPPVPASPTSPVPAPSTSPASPKTLVFTETELQEEFTQLLKMLGSTDKASIEYLTVKLEQDRMLISARGEVLGNKAEINNIEVTFKGRTISARGTVKALGYEPTLILVFDITTTNGKPAITISEFNAGSIGMLLNMIGFSKEKIQNIINSSIESRGLKLPFDLENLSIRDGKLIIEYK